MICLATLSNKSVIGRAMFIQRPVISNFDRNCTWQDLFYTNLSHHRFLGGGGGGRERNCTSKTYSKDTAS